MVKKYSESSIVESNTKPSTETLKFLIAYSRSTQVKKGKNRKILLHLN
jgi:hypothetical protein